MTDINETDTIQLEKVPNKLFGSVNKFWQRTFVSYEIWWWFLILGLFIWVMVVGVKYLPVLRPDTFRDQDIEQPLEKLPALTVFYPPRVVPGHEYKLNFSFQIPTTSSANAEKVTFRLSSDMASTKLDPAIINYDTDQTGWIVQQVTLKVLDSSTPHEKTTITVTDSQSLVSQKIDIAIVNPSYSLGLIITFVITFGAIIGRVLFPILMQIWLALKKRFGNALTDDTAA